MANSESSTPQRQSSGEAACYAEKIISPAQAVRILQNIFGFLSEDNLMRMSERIAQSECTEGTKRMAAETIPWAARMLGQDASVFWDAENDQISFESEDGEIIVGHNTTIGGA